MLIDSHAHITSSSLFEEASAILDRAKQAGVKKLLNIATDIESLERGLELQKTFPWVFNSASTTTHEVEKYGEAHFATIEKYAPQIKAIGETGLDYHYEFSPRHLQKEFFIRYLDLAKRFDLPVVIHCREAFQDFFDIVDQEQAKKICLHCFTGTMEEARGVIDRGFYLSLSGIATFKKSFELHEVARWVPLDRLLIETDSPHLAPQKHRGKTNEPAFIVETARFIAEQRGISFEELAEATSHNAETLFNF